MAHKINTPLVNKVLAGLKTGQEVLINGVVYVARDQAHKRMVDTIKKGRGLPFELKGQIVFYAGPTPTPPGKITGSIGPTTSYRMDDYILPLLKKGLKGTIGKGERSPEVYQYLQKYKAVYFAAIGGVAALLSKCIVSSEVIAYPDLGPEAVRRLEVKDFPVVVAFDLAGKSIYR